MAASFRLRCKAQPDQFEILFRTNNLHNYHFMCQCPINYCFKRFMQIHMSAPALKPSVISLSDQFGPLVVQGRGIEVEFRDGEIHVRSGKIASVPTQQALANTASPTALKVGDVVTDGPNKGWIYCETRQGDCFLVAPKDSGVMRWREAMDFAARENAALPSKSQLHAMYEARDIGALKGTFNVTGSHPAGWYWSATQYDLGAWCQNFRNGGQCYDDESYDSSVRCVRRYSAI